VLLVEDHVGLLLTAGSDKGVDLLDLDVVELLAGLLDGGLAGALVNDEHEGVVVFDGLDGGLGGAGELHNCEFVPGELLLHGVHDSLGGTLLGESLGETESGLGPDLVLPDGVHALLHVFGNSLSLHINTLINHPF
jgi:hypothetical protein